jgi:ABC-type sugar transport system ATPase subunit
MSFVDGRLVRGEGPLDFEACGQRLALPGRWQAAPDLPVSLGVRPEAVRLAEPGGPRDALLSMDVVLVEALGGGCLVTLERPGWRLAARFDARAGLAEGQKVEIMVDLRQAHLFEQATGRALGLRGPAG